MSRGHISTKFYDTYRKYCAYSDIHDRTSRIIPLMHSADMLMDENKFLKSEIKRLRDELKKYTTDGDVNQQMNDYMNPTPAVAYVNERIYVMLMELSGIEKSKGEDSGADVYRKAALAVRMHKKPITLLSVEEKVDELLNAADPYAGFVNLSVD